MSKVQMLRALVKQRLTAAAEEIFGLFERTIAEYEEELCRSKEENERQQKLLDAVFNPQLQLDKADVQQLSVVKEEVPPEQQEWSSRLDQEDPEPPHIKEEQEELWTSQERKQLQGLEDADITKFTFIPVPVKSEDDEDEAQSSQLHERRTEQMETEADEDCGGSEPARNSDLDSPLQPAIHDKTSPSSESETDDSRDWEETKEPHLNPLQNHEVPVSDMEYSTGIASVSSSEYARRFRHKLQKQTRIQTGRKTFSGSVCGKRFKLKQNLKHLTVHTGEKTEFSCSVCSKRFSRKCFLMAHMKLHSEGKHFTCSVCKTRFSSRGAFIKHMRIHPWEKPFSCSVCNKRFTQQNNLRRHLAVHTGEKPFSCSVCNKRFSQHGDVRRHSVVHTGEKPFSCSACGKNFTQKGHLRRHLRVHAGEKQFSCSVCDKRFSRRYRVKNHKCVGERSIHT